jgi:hypothetical protein
MREFDAGIIAGFIAGMLLGAIVGHMIWAGSGKPTTPATAWQVYLETQDEWTKKMNEAMGKVKE